MATMFRSLIEHKIEHGSKKARKLGQQNAVCSFVSLLKFFVGFFLGNSHKRLYFFRFFAFFNLLLFLVALFHLSTECFFIKMSRLFYSCSSFCPLIRFFIPRLHRSSDPNSNGWWDEEEGEPRPNAIVIEMSGLEEFGKIKNENQVGFGGSWEYKFFLSF